MYEKVIKMALFHGWGMGVEGFVNSNKHLLFYGFNQPVCGCVNERRRVSPSLNTSRTPGLSLAISLCTVSTKLAL